MPVISVPQAFNEEELYVDLRSIFGHSLFLKCEGFNFAGSIKLKAATEMVEAAERDGVLTPGSILVESSSGNLGVALSMIAASKGYRFLCVTDLRCNLSTRLLMEALGSQVHVITEPDANGGGLLGARTRLRPGAVCLRRPVRVAQPVHQSAQLEGALPHDGTGDRSPVPAPGRAVHRGRHHRDPDGLRALLPGVAPAGAGRRSGQRRLGGLRWCAGPPDDSRPGHGVRPPLLEESYVDEVVRVEEADTIRACHRLARRGFLFGGSTGTVVSGAMGWLAQQDAHELTAVAIAPDLGERYLDTIYQTNWLQDLYGEDVLSSDELTAGSRSVSLTRATDAVTGPAAALAAR